jgi:hypothetical protein
MGDWAKKEMAGCQLGDRRLDRRAALLLERMAAQPQLSIPAACKGLAETTAAYRFFDNEAVGPQQMLKPHVEATLERIKGHPRVLLVQDTTELDFTGRAGGGELGPLNWPDRVGLFDHSMVAFSPQGLCLGVVSAHIWTRRGPPKNGLRKSKPIQRKESARWVRGYREGCRIAREMEGTLLISVADREGDIYELFVEAEEAAAQGARAEWIVRSCQDRSLPQREPGEPYRHKKLWAAVRAAPPLGTRTLRLPKREGRPERQATLSVQTIGVELKPPFRKGGRPAPVEVWAVRAVEVGAPDGQEPLEWVLLSSMAASSLEEACQILDHYLVRWQIETYFRVLKGTCKVEDLQLRGLKRLGRCIVLKKIAAWRTLYVTHLARLYPQAPCTVAFEEAEWKSVHVVSEGWPLPAQPPSLWRFIAMLAALGGHLGRKADGPPGPIRLCIGLQTMHHYATAWRAFGPERSKDV